MKNNYSLIQVTTKDKLVLNGLFAEGEKQKIAFIFVHGFMSDFYSHSFYHYMVDALRSKGSACILGQTRGTGLYTEFITSDAGSRLVGSFHEKLEEAHHDISAYITFLIDSGYERIGLIGHSLGTIKVVRYLFEGEYFDKISKIILLAPFDKNGYMQRKMPGQLQDFVLKAKQAISEGRGDQIVPVPEFEDFPVTFTTYVSWYTDDDFGKMWDFYQKEYDFPILREISIPVKVIIGEKDEFVDFPEFGVSALSVLTTFKKFTAHCLTQLIKDSNHTFDGYEQKVAAEVADFV